MGRSLIGRREELSKITRALERASNGEPAAVLISGEAGIGKSRLVKELVTEARMRGAIVAEGDCVEMGSDVPFVAMLAALRSLLRQSSASLAPSGELLGTAGAPVIGSLSPELFRFFPELPLPETISVSDDAQARAAADEGVAWDGREYWRYDDDLARPSEAGGTGRLFAVIVELLERLSADRLVVLVLEDLQWADASTRQLVLYLFRSLRFGRQLVVGTYRSDDLHRRHPLRPFVAEALRSRGLVRIDLPPFTWEEVQEKIAEMRGVSPDPSEVDHVYVRSDGNPFFVEELVHAARSGARAGLSESLRELLLTQVHALPEAAQKVVRVAAVGSGHALHALLSAVTELPEDALLEAVRTAVEAHLLEPTPDGNGYRFRHALVREAVAEEILPAERVRWSSRCAEALTADPTLVSPEEYCARLAGFWAEAHEPARALPMFVRAAEEARRRYAFADQLHLLMRALNLWHALPPETQRGVRLSESVFAPSKIRVNEIGQTAEEEVGKSYDGYADLLAESVLAASLSGDRDLALALCREGAGLSASQADDLRRAWFWAQRAQLVQDLALGDGHAELERAQALVRQLPASAVHADILVNVASWGARHQPGPESERAAEKAVEYARVIGDEYRELNARVTRAWLLSGTERFEDGIEEVREVLRRTQEASDVTALGRACIMLPSLLEGLGRSGEAIAAADESLALCHARGLPNVAAWVHCNRSLSLFSLGRWPESLADIEEAGRLARSRKARGLVALRRAEMGYVYGDLAEAERHLAKSRELFGDQDPQPQITIGLATLAIRIAARQGRVNQMRAEFDSITSSGLPPATERYSLPLLSAAAAAEADAWIPGDPEHDRRIIAIRTFAERIPARVPLWRAYRLVIAAELARAAGATGLAPWTEAVDALVKLDRPYELASARVRWAAAALAARTPRARVAPALVAANITAEALGARFLEDDVEALAKRAGIVLDGDKPNSDPTSSTVTSRAAGTVTPTDRFGLTPREIEVLRLVARGYTNGRIASTLSITVKTASVHVSHILAKLGVTSRTEAAALAFRLGVVELKEA